MNELRDLEELINSNEWPIDLPMLKVHITTLLAANREQKAEIERLKAELNRYPADWWQDSSLKTWFPFTAEELDRLKAELASLRASVGEKPEDAWKRGWSVGYIDALNHVDVLRPKPYLAPTLPGEEK